MADNTHETKIVISGDDSGAVSALTRVKTALRGGILGALNGVRTAITGVMRSLGAIGLVMHGIQLAVEGFKKLNEWVHRSETAAKALREELAKSKYDTQVAHAAAAYEKLTKQLAEANRLEKERNDILEQRKRYARDIEDANLERDKQMEIAKLDPNASDYADRKKEIERRYEIAASDAKAARAGEDVRGEAKKLYGEADRKEADANRLEKEWKKQDAIVASAQEKSWRAAMKARNGGDDEKSAAKQADEEFKRQFDKAKKIREEIDKTLQEAASLRNRAAELTGGNLAANTLNEANKQRIANEAAAEAAEKKRKEDEDQKREDEKNADEKKRRERNLEDKTLDSQKEEDIAALDPTSPDYERRKKEIERTYEMRSAENREARIVADTEEKVKKIDDKRDSEIAKLDPNERGYAEKRQEIEQKADAEVAKLDPNERGYAEKRQEIEQKADAEKNAVREAGETDRQAAAEERAAIGIRHDRERGEDRAARAADYYGRLAEQIDSSRPQNRLTAMGLGSGASVDRTAQEQASNVKTLVQLLKEQVELTRKADGGSAATYAP